MRKILFGIALFLISCGQPMEITYHYNTPKETIAMVSGNEQVIAYARAEWVFDLEDPIEGHLEGHWECDIWLQPKEVYGSEDCWNRIVEHEKRHCYEGDYHPETGEGSYVKGCPYKEL